MKEIILGIDPGDQKSGVIILEDGIVCRGDNLENEKLFSLIDEYTLFKQGINLTVVYEDIRPFTSRFNMNTINTIKIIGRLEYVLNQRMVSFRSITRNEVKYWVYNNFFDIAYPMIVEKAAKSPNKKKDGSDRSASFVFVDDKIVILAMKSYWGINVVKGGKSPMGIKTHAWQALGVVTFYLGTV